MILGADFSYSDGKAYTSGTYLDTLYNKGSSKLAETEQTFSKLMFRTELLEITRNKKTTQILQAYKGSLENYLTQQNILFTKKMRFMNYTARLTPSFLPHPLLHQKLYLNHFLKGCRMQNLKKSKQFCFLLWHGCAITNALKTLPTKNY